MEPTQSQPNNDMTPEEAKASLGIATFLQGQMMPQEGMEESQEPETDDADLESKVSSIVDEKLNKFKEELLGDLEQINGQEETQETNI